MAERTDYYNPEYFTNRELSWVLFNHRILGESKDVKNPFLSV